MELALSPETAFDFQENIKHCAIKRFGFVDGSRIRKIQKHLNIIYEKNTSNLKYSYIKYFSLKSSFG